MRAMITGDSHTAALHRGHAALLDEGRWPAGLALDIRPLGGGHLTRAPFFSDRGDHAEITTAEYRRRFDRLPLASDGPDVVYGLSAPLHSVRVWRHPAWRRFSPAGLAPGSAAPGESATPVSSGLLRRVILDDQRHVLALIAILLRGGRQTFVVEAPRPFRHHPALDETSPDLVAHIDAIYRRTIRRELDAMGVPVVSVPEDCLDRGFMRDDYAQPGDPHHGNAAYGRLMMERVAAFLEGAADAPATARRDRQEMAS